MIICIGYYVGERHMSKDFQTFDDLREFIEKCMEVKQGDSFSFDLNIYVGKEETRVRNIINKKIIDEANKK